MVAELWHAENDFLSVTVFEDASAHILDKMSGTNWQMGRVALQEDGPVDVGHIWLRRTRSSCEQYTAHFQGVRDGSLLRFTLLGRERLALGQFSCRVRLEGPKFVVQVVGIDETIPSLAFPTPLVSESLVLPMGVGRWVREPLPQSYTWVYPAHLNMRWFGGLRGESGWIAIVEEGYADAGTIATQLAITPLWLKSLGKWASPRTVSYQFVNGGYVGLAKTFRTYAIEHGLHYSLQEKMENVPPVRNLLGGPLLSFMEASTYHAVNFEERFQPVPPKVAQEDGKLRVMVSHAQVREAIEQALKSGITHGLAVVRGWGNDGYDEMHPDIWPPDPGIGTLEELKQILHTGQNLTVALHDNYQDMYQQAPSWPKGVNITAQGHPMPAGFWAGGQAYTINARDGLAYAQRNWEQINTLHPHAMFIDTTTALQFYQSYEPGNTLTRAQDEEYKTALLRFYKEQNVALGSEEGADFGMPWVDWIENRHHRVAGESIPLWSLVYHDAAFYTRYGRGPLAAEEGGTAPRWLTDMLWGYMLLWSFGDDWQGKGRLEDIARLQHVNDWHQRTGADEMLSHRYLSEDGQVEETTFASGVSIVVNFAAETRNVEGMELAGHSYHIREV